MQDDKLIALPKKAFWIIFGFAFFILAITVPTGLRIGVDTYHDGAIFPSAVGMAQGLHLFSEVNNQYGFMYALIQTPFLYLFGNYLLVARIVGGIVFFLTLLVAYLLIRQVWGQQASFLVAMICVALNPSWSYLSIQTLNAFGAWINQYGVMLIIISIFLTLRELDKKIPRAWIFLLSGGIALSSTFVRPEFFLVWFLQTLFLFYSSKRGKFSDRNFVFWTAGSILAGVVSAGYLVITGSLADYFNQMIVVWFSSPPNSAHLGIGNVFTFATSCLSFLFYFALIYYISRYRLALVYTVSLTILVVYLLGLVLPNVSEIEFLGKNVGPYLYTAFDGFLFNYSSAVVATLVLVSLFSIRSNRESFGFKTLFLQVTSVGLLAQLHNVNSAYIVMFSPIFVTWFMFWSNEYRQKYPTILIALRNSFISLVTVSLVIGSSLVFKPIYEYNSYILKGMAEFSLEKRNDIDAKFELLDRYVEVGELYFDCPYGLFSVSQSGLYIADKWTWNEIPKKWLQQSIQKSNSGDFLLRCNGGLDGVITYDELKKSGVIKIVESFSDFELYQFR